MKSLIVTLLNGLLLVVLFNLPGCQSDPVFSDPCDQSICLNGGTCSDGYCNCPEGFTGADCSDRQTPKALIVNSLRLPSFPELAPDQKPWDFSGGPDLKLVWYVEDELLVELEATHPDAVNGSSNTFILPENFRLEQPEALHTIFVYDKDGKGKHQLMGLLAFQPYAPDNGFPHHLVVEKDPQLQLEMELSYRL